MRSLYTHVRLSFLALAFVFTGRAEDANLLKNPGFEVLSEDGKGAAEWSTTRAPSVTLRCDAEVKRSGARSGRVSSTDASTMPAHIVAWRQNVTLPPQGTVLLSGWAKGEDASCILIHVLHRDANDTVLRNQNVASLEGTFDWKEFGGVLPRLPDAVSLQVVVGLKTCTGSVWFDDLFVGSIASADSRFGAVSMAPSGKQVAGSTVPLAFTFTIGERGLALGGHVELRWDRWRPAREYRFSSIRIESTAPEARFEVFQSLRRRKTWPPEPQPVCCRATLESDMRLPSGALVTIAGEMTFSAHDNVVAGLRPSIAAAAGGLSMPVGDTIRLEPQGGAAAALSCTAEARPVAGRPGRLTVAVTDAHGNPASGFRGTVTFDPVPGADLPASCTFTTDDRGSRDLAVVWPPDRVSRATANLGETSATSNPVLPRAADEPGIYFGDLHAHTELSGDAVGDPDMAYDYARRFYGLDFAGLADHSPRGGKWTRNVEVSNRHNRDGRFATIVGFEWSDGRCGHRNGYYRGVGPEQPRLPDNMAAWWGWLEKSELRALTPLHHSNTDSHVRLANGRLVWGPGDWSVINHKYQRIVEICQARGSFELPGPNVELRVRAKDCGASVQAALAQGHRLGFFGSTDAHSGRPGNGPARAVVVTPDFSRGGVWDALYGRSCYATSGKHIILLFSVNGHPMGSEVTARSAAPRRVVWRAVGTGVWKRIDLLRNNEVVQSWDGAGDDMRGEFEFADALTGTEWWYLRGVQEDTEMAWSSPIWIDPEQ